MFIAEEKMTYVIFCTSAVSSLFAIHLFNSAPVLRDIHIAAVICVLLCTLTHPVHQYSGFRQCLLILLNAFVLICMHNNNACGNATQCARRNSAVGERGRGTNTKAEFVSG